MNEMNKMLAEADKQHHEAVVAHEERLHKERMLRLRHNQIENRVLNPDDPTHKVPIHPLESGKDGLDLAKVDHLEDKDPIPDDDWYKRVNEGHKRREILRRETAGDQKSSRSSVKIGQDGKPKRSTRENSASDSGRDDAKAADSDSELGKGSPNNNTLQSKQERFSNLNESERKYQESIDRVSAAKSVMKKRETLFDQKRPDPRNQKQKSGNQLAQDSLFQVVT